jgi:DNA mismatch repair ATPase MutS
VFSLKKALQLYQFTQALIDLVNDIQPSEEGAMGEMFSRLRDIRQQFGNFCTIVEKGVDLEEYYRTNEIYINRQFDTTVAELRDQRDAVLTQIDQMATSLSREMSCKNLRVSTSNTHGQVFEGPKDAIDRFMRRLGD